MSNYLVVGGSSGIGLTLIENLVESGAELIINIDQKDIKDSSLSKVRTFLTDLSNDSDIKKSLIKLSGIKFDSVFYCAGIAEEPSRELKSDYNFINKITAVNSTSLVKILSEVTPSINKGGSIVVVSSAHSQRAAAQNPIYSATKGFIDAFIVSYSRNLINQDPENPIRINGVAPEMVDTPLIHDLFVGREDDLKKVTDTRIMGRLLESKEVVNVMLFLASDAASGMTGNITPIGGNI